MTSDHCTSHLCLQLICTLEIEVEGCINGYFKQNKKIYTPNIVTRRVGRSILEHPPTLYWTKAMSSAFRSGKEKRWCRDVFRREFDLNHLFGARTKQEDIPYRKQGSDERLNYVGSDRSCGCSMYEGARGWRTQKRPEQVMYWKL